MILRGVNLLEDGELASREADFAKASEFGFDYIEPNLGGAITRRRRANEVAVVQSYLEEYGLDLSVHLPWTEIHLGSPREHVRKGSVAELEAYLDIAAEMGADTAVAHLSSGLVGNSEWDREYVRSCMVESVSALDEYAADRGVELTVENKQSFVTAEDMKALLAETGASMTFDTGHARASGMSSSEMARFLDEYRDRVAQVHLNDTRGARDEHLPLGAGELDVPAILRPLTDGWDGRVLLDLSVLDYEYVRVSKERLDAIVDG